MVGVSVLTFAAFSSLFTSVLADDHGVVFLYPPANLTLQYMDTLNVTWTSNFTNPLIYTWCRAPDSSDVLTKLVQEGKKTNDSSLIQLSWPDVASCWINVKPNKTAGNGANSQQFTVLQQARESPIIAGIEQPASSTSSATASSTSTKAPATSKSAAASEGGTSSGTKIGIAVGVTLGVILAIAIFLAAFLLRRRRVRNGNGPANNQLLDLDSDAGKSDFGDASRVPLQPMPAEVEANHEKGALRHELADVTIYEMGTGDEGRAGELSADRKGGI